MRKMILMAVTGFLWKKFQVRHGGRSASRYGKYGRL